MDTRRDFIKKSVMVCAALSLPLTFAESGRALPRELKIRNPKRALILCYSQTGFTSRYGKLIAVSVPFKKKADVKVGLALVALKLSLK